MSRSWSSVLEKPKNTVTGVKKNKKLPINFSTRGILKAGKYTHLFIWKLAHTLASCNLQYIFRAPKDNWLAVARARKTEFTGSLRPISELCSIHMVLDEVLSADRDKRQRWTNLTIGCSSEKDPAARVQLPGTPEPENIVKNYYAQTVPTWNSGRKRC